MAKKTFSELINDTETPVLVDFYADWCGPCQTMSPIVEQIAQKLEGKLKVIKIDTDRNQAVSAKFGIRGIPAFILFKGGKILWQGTGVMPRSQMENALAPFLK